MMTGMAAATTDGGAAATALISSLVSLLIGVGVYCWYAAALAAVFDKIGAPRWKAWVPVISQAEVLERTGRPAWHVVIVLFVPLYGLWVWAMALHRINQSFGRGGLYTVLAVLLTPAWASLLGWGPDQPDFEPRRIQQTMAPSAGRGPLAVPESVPLWAGAPMATTASLAPGQPWASGYPAGPQPAAAPGGLPPVLQTPLGPAQPAGFGSLAEPGQPGFGTSAAPGQPWPVDPVPRPMSSDPVEGLPASVPASASGPAPYAPQPIDLASFGQPAPAPPVPDAVPAAQVPGPAFAAPAGLAPGAPAAQTAGPAFAAPAVPVPGVSGVPAAPAGPAFAAPAVPVAQASGLAFEAPVPDPRFAAAAPAVPVSAVPVSAVPGPATVAEPVTPAAVPASSGPTALPSAGLVPPPPGAILPGGQPGAPSNGSVALTPVAPGASPPGSFVVASAAGAAAVAVPEPVAPATSLPAVSGSGPAPAPLALVRSQSDAQATMVINLADDDVDGTVVVRRPTFQPWVLSLDDGRTFVIRSRSVVLGRRPESVDLGVQVLTVTDDGRTMSKTHARLDLVDDVWRVTDMGSTNGVVTTDATGEEIDVEPGKPTPVYGRLVLGAVGMRLTPGESS